MLLIQSELGLLLDSEGRRLQDCKIELSNDELVIKDSKRQIHTYKIPEAEYLQSHQIQKSIFNAKKEIIESCLFGVDINNTSCEITKLRLWIELLKYSFYKDIDKRHLETLPNIDINIKCGNSLISYFDLKHSLSHYPNIRHRIEIYKKSVNDYKEGYGSKSRIEQDIKELKESFKNFCFNDKFKNKIKSFNAKCEAYSKKYGNFLAKDDENLCFYVSQNFGFFEFDENEARKEFENLKSEYDSIYNLEGKKPFEWRFEFPEVLDNEGNFKGFDLVIGNPPYVVKNKKEYPHYQWNNDLYTMFFEAGFKIGKPNGYLNFITPRFWLVNKRLKNMREYMLNYVNLLSLSETNPFKVAVTENVVTELQICKPKQDFIKHYKEIDEIFLFANNIDKETFMSNSGHEIIFNVDTNLNALLDKIANNTIPLKKLSKSKRGAEYGKKFIKQFNAGMQILIGEDLKPYAISWNNTFCHTALKDIQRLLNFYNNKNIIYLRRVDKRLSASISNISFAFTKNIYGIKIINNKYNCKFILGLLNSKLLNFYYLKKFTTKKENIFPEIQTYLYENLPIPKITSKNEKLADEIIDLVDKILNLKGKNAEADTSEFEREIDLAVYRLYGLSADEIEIVENG